MCIVNTGIYYGVMEIVLSDKLIEFLRDHVDRPLVLAVSGGPDSMCMAHMIKQYFINHWYSMCNLHIAHFHHGLRSESDTEMRLVQSVHVDCCVHVWHYTWQSMRERDLRLARYTFFYSLMEELWSTVLIMGHNLTDRIETSLMNMKRWCQIKWFLNMRTIEQQSKHYRIGEKYHYWTMTTIRPLLNYSKYSIQDYCDRQWIQYMIDQSNFDTTISMRNKIRSDIVMKLSQYELSDRQSLYHRLEECQTYYIDPVRDEQECWYSAGIVGDWSLDYVSRLFDWSWCYADMSQGRLLERQCWIAHSFSGQKFVWWWKRWIKKKKVWFTPLSS